jgi:hypothetical protein
MYTAPMIGYQATRLVETVTTYTLFITRFKLVPYEYKV